MLTVGRGSRDATVAAIRFAVTQIVGAEHPCIDALVKCAGTLLPPDHGGLDDPERVQAAVAAAEESGRATREAGRLCWLGTTTKKDSELRVAVERLLDFATPGPTPTELAEIQRRLPSPASLGGSRDWAQKAHSVLTKMRRRQGGS